jgi:hypothetical protein
MKHWCKYLLLIAWSLAALPAIADGAGNGAKRDKKSLSVSTCSEDTSSLSKQVLCAEKTIPETINTEPGGVRAPKLKNPQQRR